MCFSAGASFLAGGTLSVIGGATLKKTKTLQEKPFASIPLLFGVQQAIEGMLWLAFQYNLLLLQSVTTFLFSFFAYAFWPAFIPFAVRLLETDNHRKKALSVFLTVGSAVSLYLLYYIIRYPVTSEIMHHSIAYTQTVPFGTQMFWVYAIAGVGSCFISSHRPINLFGVLLFFSIVISYHFYSMNFVSVWCFFAAILSGVIYFFFASKHAPSKSPVLSK
jgi:hypothetical protein